MKTIDHSKKDLIVIVPDIDMEVSIRRLLLRTKALGIRQIEFDVNRHFQRDAGCRTDSHNYLKLWQNEFNFAMVIFDLEGCGNEASRINTEDEVQELLNNNGWRDRSSVIVIEPELESWIWSDSPELDEVLGWSNRSISMREWVRSQTDYWPVDNQKPARPKEAFREVLRELRLQPSASLFDELANRMSVRRCTDPSFQKFKGNLLKWFAPVSP